MTQVHPRTTPEPLTRVDPGRPICVQVRGLDKTFGSAQVLHGVDLDVRAGEIHALVGQNGSGKSTLIKILSGVYPADRGSSITVAGHPLPNPVRPSDLRQHGLAFVHQDLGLVDECSVVENLRLGQYRSRRFSRRINWRSERTEAAATLRRMHAEIAPSRLVSSLSPAEKGLVAVGRALQGLVPGAGCIVFDESTRALPREVLPDFYRIIRGLAAAGTAIILVSHRLDEVLTVAERVTVLRDGAVVAAARPTAHLTERSLAHLMLGRELETLLESREDLLGRKPDDAPGRLVMRAHGVGLGQLKSLDLDLVAGEIVGVTGPTNSGYEDVPAALTGAAGGAKGRLEIDGRVFNLPARGPRALISAGVVLAPEDRASAGLALNLPAQQNLTLPRARHRGRLLLTSAWQADEFETATRMLGITPAQPHLTCATYSGGNQQKIMLAKWLLNQPKVLVLHEPTQAVDVAARTDILRAIGIAAARGVTVVIASSEPQDLSAVCNRVIVIRDGAVHHELRNNITPQAITAATYSTSVGENPSMRNV